MANEMTYAAHGDLRLAAVLNREIYELMHDMVDLRGTMYNAGDPTGSGSAAIKIRQLSPDDIMGTPGEVTDTLPTAMGDGSATVTVAERTLRYDVGDLFAATSPDPQAEISAVVRALYGGAIREASDLITDLYTGFATSEGNTGVVLTVDDIYDAQFAIQLQDNMDPTSYVVLHPKQWNELQASLRGEGGAIQYSPETNAALRAKTMGFKGSWNGHMFFTSNRIESDGTDYTGAMYSPGALAIAEGSAQGALSAMFGNVFASVAIPGAPVWVEFQRDASKGLTECVGHYLVGVDENEDLKGVKIVSVD
ncbi:MAG: hypothetical protein ABII82_13445 [Verrucomicrobiota bacterium]